MKLFKILLGIKSSQGKDLLKYVEMAIFFTFVSFLRARMVLNLSHTHHVDLHFPTVKSDAIINFVQ